MTLVQHIDSKGSGTTDSMTLGMQRNTQRTVDPRMQKKIRDANNTSNAY